MSPRRWELVLTLALLTACAPAAAPGQAGAPGTGTALPTAPPASEPAPIAPGAIPPSGPYAPGWDALHYDIEIALPAGPGWIAGRTSMRALRTAPGVTSLPLDLIGLAVTRVRVDGREVQAEANGRRILVPVPAAPRGDTVHVEVTY